MTDYFGEKTGQVEPGDLTAFGINVSSRYSKANEVIEMLAFAKHAALKGVAHYVTNVFYDSKANICSFTLADSVKEGDPVAQELLNAALSSVSQFEWFGYVHHGGELLGSEE